MIRKHRTLNCHYTLSSLTEEVQKFAEEHDLLVDEVQIIVSTWDGYEDKCEFFLSGMKWEA